MIYVTAMATLCPHCGKDTEQTAANKNSLSAQPEDKPYPNAAPKSDAIKQLYSMIVSGRTDQIKDFSKNIKMADRMLGAQNEQ
jgi:hypothetical protein